MPTVSAGIELRHEGLGRLDEARVQTDKLFDLVKPGFLYQRPIPERHRIIFYLGHLEAFDWNLLRERVLDESSFEPELDRLFAFGIDPVGGGLPSDQPSDWPSLTQVRRYVSQIREAVDAGLTPGTLAQGRSQEDWSAGLLLNVAIEHRLMHAETLAYMLHQLPLNQKVSAPGKPQKVVQPAAPGMIDIPAGDATPGLCRSDGDFGWDNEYDAHVVSVPAFSIDRYKITNREYLRFLNARGYENRAFWSQDDWNWKVERDISHPAFWKKKAGVWRYRTMFADVPLPLEWPVYASQAEASAYARWAGKALPTEAQWHRAAYGSPEGRERPYSWGAEAPSPRRGNFDFQRWDPTPVAAFPAGQSAFGVFDLIGNGWEWTSSEFASFPGFRQFSFYPGYSANFFDGKHFVMKGGSARTAACMLRRSFRNWFQAHYQYVYAGFRCVSN
jgi:ergothioneine biosynthesis protein EgtB